MLVLTVLFGGMSLYLKTKNELTNLANEKINEAEERYIDSTKAGGIKFNWVVNVLYKYVPVPLKFFISKEFVEKIVQRTFDSMESFTVMQFDKAVEKITKK